MYSFECRWFRFSVTSPGRAWEHHEASFNSDAIDSGNWPLRRPVVLSLTNPRRGTMVDVDNVRLRDASGNDVVANGDFSHGGARWSFSVDGLLPWHILNLWVHVLFELGWVGVLAVGIAVGASLARLAAAIWSGDEFSVWLLAALCGFLLVGFSESLLDGPRVTTLFFLLVFTALLRPAPGRRTRRAHL